MQNSNTFSKKPSKTKDSAITILTNGCYFSGKLYCKGASRIAGRIEGQIISEGLLIIEESAYINADVKVEEAVIQGYIKGKIEATSRIELTSTAVVEGDIMSSVLVINEGAKFNGRSFMLLSDPKIKPEENNLNVPVVEYVPEDTANQKEPELKVIDGKK